MKEMQVRPDINCLRFSSSRAGVEVVNRMFQSDELDTVDNRLLAPTTSDVLFFSSMKDRYGDAALDARALYRQSMTTANTAIEYINKIAFGDADDTFQLRTRTITNDLSPTQRFKLMQDNRHTLLGHELRRQFILADIAASLERRAVEERLEQVLDTVQMVADERLFEGRETHNIDIYTHHDHNNRFKSMATRLEDLPDTNGLLHVKKRRWVVRSSEDTGVPPVWTHPRHKSASTSIIKALRKAQKNGGVINPYEYVSDALGMQYVVFGNRDDCQDYAEYVVDTFVGDRRIPTDEANPYVRRDASSDVGARSASSDAHSFVRYELNVGLDIPIELVFYSLSDYYDSQYHIGNRREDGTYDGSSHALLEQRRLMSLHPILFPQKYYGADARTRAVEHMADTAQHLLYKDRVAA